MSPPRGLVPVLLAVTLAGAAGVSSALYVYVPDVLVITTSEEADEWLDTMEVEFGIQGSDDPTASDNPHLKRLDRTTRVMERHWDRLDRDCDPNAVFALMYLVTTYGVRQHIQEEFFDDNEYLATITVSFAQLYLSAYDGWEKGKRDHVPLPWLEAFDYATTGQSSITEDEFLGMNAHINYDLAVAIASLGTTAPDGTSRKVEMDRINHVLADVTDDVGYWIAYYYGPEPPAAEPSDEHTSPTDGDPMLLVLEPIYFWREHAWANAEVIESLEDDPDARAAHDAEMQQYAWTVAQGLQSPKVVSPEAERLAYCQASQ